MTSTTTNVLKNVPAHISFDTTAIVKIQGKQHLVTKGLKIECEKIDSNIGEEIIFDQVLCFTQGNKTEFGSPVLEKTVKAKIIAHNRDKKVIIFKKIRRQGYQRKAGHRQNVTVLEILEIK